MSDEGKPGLLLVRRVGDGVGGAAKAFRKFETMFAGDWTVSTLSAGGFDGRVSGAKGPSWFRNLRFASTANRALSDIDADVVFTLERGVRGDVFRTADGVHRRWLELAGANPLKRLANPLHTLLPQLERDTYASVSRIVCQGEMIADDVRRFYPEFAHKVRIIPTGYDPARFYVHPEGRTAAKRAAGLRTDELAFLFVGSGWKIKNLADTLRLFAAFTAHFNGNARLLIAGEGREKSYRQLAGKLGVADRVNFLGKVSDVAPLLRAADAVLMPSVYDTFPNAALEAVACGAPLVLTETNGARELVNDGHTGVILPHGFDPHKAAERLHGLIESLPSSAKVAVTVTGRTAESEKRRYLELLAEVLAEKRRAE